MAGDQDRDVAERGARYISTPSYAGVDRRNGNGNGRDWTSLRAWAQAIGIVGIPGAIAIFLVYIGATQVPTLVRQLDVVLLEVRQNREALREHTVYVQTLTRIAQKACMNAAKDDNARQNCFEK